MKHKWLVVFLAIAATLCMAFGFAGCSLFGGNTEGGSSVVDPNGGQSGSQGGGEQGGTQGGSAGLEFTLNDDGAYSVTGIGECKDAEIVIPSEYEGKSVTSIGKEAFKGNLFITTVVIGNNVTTIGESAFFNCAWLENITMPDGITSIGKNAFYKTAVYDYESSWNRDVLYIGKYLIQAKSEISGQCAVKPGTLLIADYAFYKCGELTSIALPDSMVSIGTRAFYGCSKLSLIDIPDSVTSIGTYAFYNTAYYNSYDYWTNDVLYIGNHLIASKDTISGNYSINSGTKTIAGGAFKDCNKLNEITIPNSVVSIGTGAFWGCVGLTSITIPDSVISIGAGSFYECKGLASVTIGSNVTMIGFQTFAYCSALASITIPDSVTSIGLLTFEHCSALASITIPDSVTSIGSAAFAMCSGLTSLVIPDSVTLIGRGIFLCCNELSEIKVDEGNKIYHSKNNCLIETKSKTLIAGCKTSEIPDDGTVTSIAHNAFYGYSGLTSIIIPDSVTSIGDEAFAGCGLVSINVPGNVISIGKMTFWDCDELTSVTIGSGVTSIGNSAFLGCGGLKQVHFENPNGWIVDGRSVSGLDDATTAADYLKSTYCDYYWKRYK